MPNADQCRSKSWHWSKIPINSDKSAQIGNNWYWSALGSKTVATPKTPPINAQCRSKLWHWSQCRSIPIIVDQSRSIPGSIKGVFPTLAHFFYSTLTFKPKAVSVDTDTQNCQPDTRHSYPLQSDIEILISKMTWDIFENFESTSYTPLNGP